MLPESHFTSVYYMYGIGTHFTYISAISAGGSRDLLISGVDTFTTYRPTVGLVAPACIDLVSFPDPTLKEGKESGDIGKFS